MAVWRGGKRRRRRKEEEEEERGGGGGRGGGRREACTFNEDTVHTADAGTNLPDNFIFLFMPEGDGNEVPCEVASCDITQCDSPRWLYILVRYLDGRILTGQEGSLSA